VFHWLTISYTVFVFTWSAQLEKTPIRSFRRRWRQLK
jgi:hypothetical protein